MPRHAEQHVAPADREPVDRFQPDAGEALLRESDLRGLSAVCISKTGPDFGRSLQAGDAAADFL